MNQDTNNESLSDIFEEYTGRLEDIMISNRKLYIAGEKYPTITFAGGVNEKTFRVFDHIAFDLIKNRDNNMTTDKGRLKSCSVSKDNDNTPIFFFLFIILGVFISWFISLKNNNMKIDWGLLSKHLLTLLPLLGLGSFLLRLRDKLFLASWRLDPGKLTIKGIIKKITLPLSDIKFLGFSMTTDKIVFVIETKQAFSLVIENERFSELLPLYDSIVFYRKDLKPK